MNPLQLNAPETNAPEAAPPPVALGDVLWRRKWLILIGTLLGLGLAIAVTLHTPKKWRADAQMVLIQRAPSGAFNAVPTASTPIIETVDTQVGMIQSPAMAERTLTYLKNRALAEGKPTDSVDMSANELSDAITVTNPRDTNLLNVSVAAKDPTQAALLADGVTHAFQLWKEDLARRDAHQAEDSLSARAGRAKKALDQAEQQTTAYQERSHLVDAEPQEKALLGQKEAAELAVQTAQQDDNAAQAGLAKLSGEFSDATAAIKAGNGVRDDASVQSLQARLQQAQSDLQTAQTAYRPDYTGPLTPTTTSTFAELKSQIDSLKAQLAGAISNTLSNKAPSLSSQGALRDQYLQAEVTASVAQARLAAAITSRDDIQQQVNVMPRTTLTATQLERVRSLAETQYQGLQSALQSARLEEDHIVSNIQITQGAEIPDLPFQPSLGRNLVLGFLLGSLLSSFLAFLLEQRDQRLRSVPELRRLASGPIIALMPQLSRRQIGGASQGRALPEVQEAVSFAWVNLSRLLQRLPSRGDAQTLLITSAVRAEGKTFTAAQLARFIAQTGRRVILVDANLHRPGRKSDGAVAPGLSDVLSGGTTLDAALAPSDVPNLTILPNGASHANPVVLLSQANAPDVFRDLRSRADVLVIDSPDCTSVPDTALLASYADCLVQVVGLNRVDAAAMLDTALALQSTSKPTLFFVNGVGRDQTVSYRNQSLMFGHFSNSLPPPTDPSRTQQLSRNDLNSFSASGLDPKPADMPHADHAPTNGQHRPEREIVLSTPRIDHPVEHDGGLN